MSDKTPPNEVLPQTDLVQIEVAKHIWQLRKRNVPNSFGGPDPTWCDASANEGIKLPVNPSNEDSEPQKFTGCLKYATCDLIDDEIRWVRWEDIGQQRQKELLKLGCYRATRGRWDKKKQVITQSDSSWDTEALPSRRIGTESDPEWIGNPFGIRTVDMGEIKKIAREKKIDLRSHRDFSPCPIGGCVTPEMQRDYGWKKTTDQSKALSFWNSESPWADAKVCPVYYRHTTIELSTPKPNPRRYAQCYLTLKEVRTILEHLGVIAAVPVFRAKADDDSYEYTFYTGYSYIQVPTRSPKLGRDGWTDRSLPIRWHASTVFRQLSETHKAKRDDKISPTYSLLGETEKGDFFTPWENVARVASVSEGQSTAMLLQWILWRRVRAAVDEKNKAGGKTIDVYDELTWEFEDKGITETLAAWGYYLDNIEIRDKRAYRKSTLIQDLQSLGVIDESFVATERLSRALHWIRARQTDRDAKKTQLRQGELRDSVTEWLDSVNLWSHLAEEEDETKQLWTLCWILLFAATNNGIMLPGDFTDQSNLTVIQPSDLKAINTGMDAFESTFRKMSLLVPEMHIIVRSNWNEPLRWMFVPLTEGYTDTKGSISPFVNSGLIILLEEREDTDSLPYKDAKEMSDRQKLHSTVAEDPTLARIRLILPLLAEVCQIERELQASDVESRHSTNLLVTRSTEAYAVASGRGPQAGPIDLIGASAAIRKLRQDISDAAASSTTVLITGETGTGKEVVARAIHYESSRATKQLVTINIQELGDVIESELFGHEKGAFTGAGKQRTGLFEEANGGTLFLDEIGDLSPALQSKLLRVLQFHEFRRVGGNQGIHIDLRLIAATHVDLEKAVKDGRFREDFFYRINVFSISTPPLRDHKEDILLLAESFLKKFNAAEGKRIHGMTRRVQQKLCEFDWPGNVRELENVIAKAVAVCKGSEIDIEHLPLKVANHSNQPEITMSSSSEPMDQLRGAEVVGAKSAASKLRMSEVRELIKAWDGRDPSPSDLVIKIFETRGAKQEVPVIGTWLDDTEDTKRSELLSGAVRLAVSRLCLESKKSRERNAKKARCKEEWCHIIANILAYLKSVSKLDDEKQNLLVSKSTSGKCKKPPFGWDEFPNAGIPGEWTAEKKERLLKVIDSIIEC